MLVPQVTASCEQQILMRNPKATSRYIYTARPGTSSMSHDPGVAGHVMARHRDDTESTAINCHRPGHHPGERGSVLLGAQEGTAAGHQLVVRLPETNKIDRS